MLCFVSWYLCFPFYMAFHTVCRGCLWNLRSKCNGCAGGALGPRRGGRINTFTLLNQTFGMVHDCSDTQFAMMEWVFKWGKIVHNEIVVTTNEQNALWCYKFSLVYLGHAFLSLMPLPPWVEDTLQINCFLFIFFYGDLKYWPGGSRVLHLPPLYLLLHNGLGHLSHCFLALFYPCCLLCLLWTVVPWIVVLVVQFLHLYLIQHQLCFIHHPFHCSNQQGLPLSGSLLLLPVSRVASNSSPAPTSDWSIGSFSCCLLLALSSPLLLLLVTCSCWCWGGKNMCLISLDEGLYCFLPETCAFLHGQAFYCVLYLNFEFCVYVCFLF